MTSVKGTGWAQLRQQIRTLESQTENIFQIYARHASANNLPQKPSDDERSQEAQIQDLLERRDELVKALARLLDSDPTITTSTLKTNNLARHREILADHRRELVRMKASIAEARDRQHLLSNVRNDIDAYRSSNPAEEENEYMLQERGRLDQSHSVIDGVLNQAYAINEQFGVQRETFASINRRIVGAASQVPGINGLIQKIGTKKRRDGIILGLFISFCVFMLWYFS